MENKTRFTLAFLFTFLFVIGLGSAASFTSKDIIFSNGDLSIKSINFTGEEGYNYTFDKLPSFEIKDNKNNLIASLNFIGDLNSSSNNTITWNVDGSSLNYSKFSLGKVYEATSTILVTRYNSTNKTQNVTGMNETFTLKIENSNSFCYIGERGGDLTIDRIRDLSSGENWEWNPIEPVSLEIRVKNTEVKKNIVVEVALYSLDGNSEDISTKDSVLISKKTRIEKTGTETINFEFELPTDIEMGDYNLFVKVYEDGNESEQCTSLGNFYKGDKNYYQGVTIESDEEAVARKLEFPNVFMCGKTESLLFRVYNFDLRDDDYKRLRFQSVDLGLNISSDRFSLEDGDSRQISLDVPIPMVISDNYRYQLYLDYDYDYDDGETRYYDSYLLIDDEVTIDGNQCSIDESNLPTIDPALDENTETKVGEDLVLLINVTNHGETGDIAVVIDGYTSWANLVTPSGYSLALAKGETKTITATFTPTKAGKQEFIIKTFVGASMRERKITVEIEEGEKSLFKSIFGDVKFNLAFWLTIGIFIILILIIFVLFVKFVAASTSKE